MGRLCGIPYFLSEESYAQEKIDTANLRKAKKELNDIRAQIEESKHQGSSKLDLNLENETGEDNPLKRCQISIAREHHKLFGSQIIRRTTNSVDFAQQLILPLPLCNNILGLVLLTKRESDLITELSNDVVDE